LGVATAGPSNLDELAVERQAVRHTSVGEWGWRRVSAAQADLEVAGVERALELASVASPAADLDAVTLGLGEGAHLVDRARGGARCSSR
jgi:hypothetical protein